MTKNRVLREVTPFLKFAHIYITYHCHKGLARARLQQRDQPEVRKEYCAVEFVSVIEASKRVAIKLESRS